MVNLYNLSRRTHRAHHALGLPDLGPFAGLVLTLLFLHLLTGLSFNAPEPFVRLPYTIYSPICVLMDRPPVVISIDVNGKLFLSYYNQNVQMQIAQQVAARHGIRFTRYQLDELRELHYLGMDVSQLPAYLSAPRYARDKMVLTGIPNADDNQQFTEHLEAAQSIIKDFQYSQPRFMLRADSHLSAGDIKRLMHTLQQSSIRRFYLATLRAN